MKALYTGGKLQKKKYAHVKDQIVEWARENQDILSANSTERHDFFYGYSLANVRQFSQLCGEEYAYARTGGPDIAILRTFRFLKFGEYLAASAANQGILKQETFFLPPEESLHDLSKTS